ncbi:PREDICTED: Ribonuclease H domain [Prunus dulcis]|uniref:PREDICTED: Ribonuclease H domain n=1 Tax=Prunus dulcis TaxID=3755 RepID=A0A5E4GFC3_PRUDU|nr:PREDICTED: Ribonuclease H domain [Prunus dulcis]
MFPSQIVYGPIPMMEKGGYYSVKSGYHSAFSKRSTSLSDYFGAARKHRGVHEIGVGVVACDDIGVFMRGETLTMSISSPQEAEVEAILVGVKMARAMGDRWIIIESDTKCVLERVSKKQLNGIWRNIQFLGKYGSMFLSSRQFDGVGLLGKQMKQPIMLQLWPLRGCNIRPPPSLFGVLLRDGLPAPPV